MTNLSILYTLNLEQDEHKLIIVANLKPSAKQTNNDDTQTLSNRKRR